MMGNVKKYFSRINKRTLPESLMWHVLPLSDDACAETLTLFLNTHYSGSDDIGIHYPISAIRKALLLDNGLSETIRAIHHQLSLAIIHQHTGDLVALVIGRPSVINHHGVRSEIVVVSLMCVHNDYKNSFLGPLLIAHYYKILDAYGLAETAIFSGHNLPFYKLRAANDYVLSIEENKKTYTTYLEKNAKQRKSSNIQIRLFNQQDTEEALELWMESNRSSECFQEFLSPEYFFQQLQNTEESKTFVITDKQNNLYAWFTIEWNEYTLPEQSNENITVANMGLMASVEMSPLQITELAITQLIHTKTTLLILPNHFNFSQKDTKTLKIMTGDNQWIYSVKESLYPKDNPINILFF